MNHAARLAREDAITDALRAADAAIGNEQPGAQALAIIAAIKGLRGDATPRVTTLERRDYLRELTRKARAAWCGEHGSSEVGPEHTATAGIDTPIGRLRVVTWRLRWKSAKTRLAWMSEYYLDDEPITVAEIRAAGLAQRPTSRRPTKRNRKAK